MQKPPLKRIHLKRIHLIGIAGTGMGSFAGLLKAAGHQVQGSDQNVYPPMSDKLKAWDIPVQLGYNKENIPNDIDLVIVGNVIRKDNPEAVYVVEKNIPYVSFPKALSDLFLNTQKSLVVSGTHGKTTTASMLAWILTHADEDPSFLIGGVPQNFGEGFRLGHGKHFVVEGDEYDTAYFDKGPKFLHYQPKSLVITSLEYDHADIYPSVEHIEAAFQKVIDLVPSYGNGGRIFVSAHAHRVHKLLNPRPLPSNADQLSLGDARAVVYGLEHQQKKIRLDYIAREIELSAQGSSFKVFQGNMLIGRFTIPQTGMIFVENALATICVALHEGIPLSKIQDALKTFEGVLRRQTEKKSKLGIRVIDDFAHHPTAVKETLAGIRARYPEGKIFAVFEPRTATSARKIFQNEYAAAFDSADETVIADVGRKELQEDQKLNLNELIDTINKRQTTRARHISQVDHIVELLEQEATTNDTIVIMSNGGFGGIFEKLGC